MAEIEIQNADYIVPANLINLPATITAGATVYSSYLKMQGYDDIAVSVSSTQNGTLTIQRYLDSAGAIPQGAAQSYSISANTQATLNVLADGLAFEYIQISISNTGGSTATLNNVKVIFSPNVAGGMSTISSTSNTSGGSSTFFSYALTNTTTAVKTSAGNLYGFTIQNPNTSAIYVQFFDASTGSVTLGTTAPKLSYWVPAGGSYDYAATGEAKISFANAITIAATTGPTGSIAPANGILINLLYK